MNGQNKQVKKNSYEWPEKTVAAKVACIMMYLNNAEKTISL